MGGLFTDMRKMAIAAGVLLLLALLFADPGGVGGKVVEADERSKEQTAEAAAQAAAAPARRANPAWFLAGGDEGEPTFDRTQANGPPPAQVPFRSEEVRGPEPTGVDFPPSLAGPGRRG